MKEESDQLMGKHGPCCPNCGLPPNEAGFRWCGCSPESIALNEKKDCGKVEKKSTGEWAALGLSVFALIVSICSLIFVLIRHYQIQQLLR